MQYLIKISLYSNGTSAIYTVTINWDSDVDFSPVVHSSADRRVVFGGWSTNGDHPHYCLGPHRKRTSILHQRPPLFQQLQTHQQ